MKPKYKFGKPIRSISEFEQSECEYFKVIFGARKKTMHRVFMENWQYRMLAQMIKKRAVFEADKIENNDKDKPEGVISLGT